MSGSHKGKISGCFFQPNRLISYKISRAMHMHGLSSHILYKANAHTMMSSQNLSVPDFMSSGKTPGVHPFKKGVFLMQTNPVWRMVRALIVTYILSGILLAVLSFALFKFRLPENQVNVAVCAVYVISCFFGGILAGKTMRTRRFFWGLVLGTLYFLFLYLMSLAQKDGVTEDTKRLLSVLAMCTLSGMAGGMVS